MGKWHALSMTCERYVERFRRRLHSRLTEHGQGREDFRLTEIPVEDATRFALSYAPDMREKAAAILAQAAADTVIEDWEPGLVRSILANRFPMLVGLRDGDALPRLAALLREGSADGAATRARRANVYREFLDFFATSDVNVLEGMLVFRLRGYRALVYRALDEAAMPWVDGAYAPDDPDTVEMDLVIRRDGLMFLGDEAGTVLFRGGIDDQRLADLMLRYLWAHPVSVLTIHDPGDWWEQWHGAVQLPAYISDLDVCFGCPLCLGVRSSR